MNSSDATGSSFGGSGDGGAPRRASRKPKYSKFTQQELPACKPILTPKWVIYVFILVGAIFVPIGVASLLSSRKVDAETVIEVGDPKETICQDAHKLNVDLLILGSHSRGPIQRKPDSGLHAVSETPGRVCDMIKGRTLDEAAEMLSRGYNDQIYDVYSYLSQNVRINNQPHYLNNQILMLTCQ
ncbi:ALA-interacting subunit 3 [Hordeum vulgare]|nr:ALA-interacting subunit 3 [Hordeum vulgare]